MAALRSRFPQRDSGRRRVERGLRLIAQATELLAGAGDKDVDSVLARAMASYLARLGDDAFIEALARLSAAGAKGGL